MSSAHRGHDVRVLGEPDRRSFEARAKRRAGAAITALLELAVGDRFLVRPGEKIAGAAMAFSSVSVVGNALRVRRFRVQRATPIDEI